MHKCFLQKWCSNDIRALLLGCIWVGSVLACDSLTFLQKGVMNAFGIFSPGCSLTHEYKWNPHVFWIGLQICLEHMSMCQAPTMIVFLAVVMRGAKGPLSVSIHQQHNRTTKNHSDWAPPLSPCVPLWKWMWFWIISAAELTWKKTAVWVKAKADWKKKNSN